MITDANKTKELTPTQERAIPIIIESPSFTVAAKKAKIQKGTISRWMRQAYFKERLEQKRQEIFEAGLNKLKGATDKAAGVMIALLDSKDETSQRLAAKDILTFALKAIEAKDLEERIERIEELLEKRFIS